MKDRRHQASFLPIILLLSLFLISSTVTAAFVGMPHAFAATTTSTGIIVPLYSYPSSNGSWETLAKVKVSYPSVPTIAIINPSSGPGIYKDPNYVNGIKKLQDAGISVLGYVHTSYSSRSVSAVKADIDKYKSLYPSINGIFFDEMANWQGREGYYRSLTDYAKSKGYIFTVGNPGADSIPSYVGTVDNIVIYERDGTPSLSYLKGWHLNYGKKNFSILPYKVGSLDKTFVSGATAYVGYLFITSDDLPNPWDSLPSYYSTLASTISSANGSGGATSTSFYTIKIVSSDTGGTTISGIWSSIKRSDGTTLKTGYTPLSFSAKSGTTYHVTVANSKDNHVFDHWDNGSTENKRTVSVSKDTVLTAYYHGTNSNQVQLTVKSAGLSGNSINGLWVEIYSDSGRLLRTGYTPLSYPVVSGESYTVTMGEWESYAFDHWDNGSKNRSRILTTNWDRTITAYYR